MEEDEVAIPCPGSWSDSDDEVEVGVNGTATSGGYAPSQALALLATAPGHDHRQRNLAGSPNAGELSKFAELPPAGPAEVLDCRERRFSSEEFLHRCATGPGRPAVLHGVPEQDHWPALGKWQNQASFLQHYGHLHVQVTEMAALHGLGKPMRVELSLEEYAVYARDNQVDWPFYVWERNFTGDRHGLLEDFATPKVMGEDLYDLSPEVREFLPLSCHLFVLVGGSRTGSNMHKDPKWSSAWNTLLCGKKRWVMFPRDTPAETIGAMEGDAYKDGGPPAYWWLDHYPRLAERAQELGMVDIIQRPGDTIFVPSGWWHATLNLPESSEDVTVACTRNIFPAETLDFVFPEMKKSDPAFARAFLEILQEKRPELMRFLPAASETSKPELVGEDPSWQLPRRHFSSLSLAECRRRFIRPKQPLIIEGLDPYLVSPETCHLSRDFLSRHFGEKMVAVFRNFRDPKQRDAEDEMEVMRLSQALSQLQRGGCEGLYLYDVSLPLKLPGLLEYLKLPRYFTHCYLQQTMRPHCFSKSWPTLFIGSAGSQARLHVDQWHSHFWMHLISGRKRWSIWHPEDTHLLCPEVLPGKVFPRFPDLSDLEAGKNGADGFHQARRIDVILEEGETLFVPGGAPHLVVNLTDTVAFAGNFMDESNFDEALADVKKMVSMEGKGEEGAMAGFAAALEEMVFDPDKSMHEEPLPGTMLAVRFSDFSQGRAAGWGPIPPDEDG